MRGGTRPQSVTEGGRLSSGSCGERNLRETSASYLLAVRVEPRDRDGQEHFIRVSVKQRGATVRYRRVVTIVSGGG